MEYGLREVTNLYSWKTVEVLILVLMEYGLRDGVFTDLRKEVIKS